MSMIQDYFISESKLHSRIYGIINTLDNIDDFESYSQYLIGDIHQTGEDICVNIVYTEPYESYTDTKKFIFQKDLFTEEYPEKKIISFWTEYIKQEETFESKHILEQTLLGLSDDLLEDLSDLKVDFSKLKEYTYRTEILNKLIGE